MKNERADMSCRDFMRRALSRGAGRAGFTFVEILIALAVTAILMTGVYGLYNAFYKQTADQDVLLEAQQNVRAGIHFIEKTLFLVGHKVPAKDTSGNPIVTIPTANASELEFRYVDPETNVRYKVTFKVNPDNDTLTMQKCVQDVDWAGCTDSSFYDVIEGLDPSVTGEGLEFSYFDGDGISISAPVSAANLANIRFIKVKLTTVTQRALAKTGATKSISATTEVNLRNLYTSSAGGDASPPAKPTGVAVREDTIGSRQGICGRLKVRWNKGTEGDLAYYRVFYTLGAVEKNKKVSLAELTDTGSQYEYTLAPGRDGDGAWNLLHSPSDGSVINTYTINVRAYDQSNNASIASDDVSGNPAGSSYTFGSGGDDSTLNPSKPGAVTGLTGADGASDGEVVLSWTAYDTSADPDVEGFRVYRSASPFAAYPLVVGAGVDWIAGEPGSGKPELAASAASASDTGGSKIGCSVYYYAIAPVNCDTSLILATDAVEDGDNTRYIEADYNVTYGDGAAGPETDSPSGSDTAPPDTAAPSAPGIAVRAGWRRVAVTLTQASNADLKQTCMYVEQSSTPPALTIVNPPPGSKGCYEPEGKLIPDSQGYWTTAELAQGGQEGFWHDSMTVETPASPSLLEVGTYSYEAVAFDLCGNGSSVTDAQATTTLCGEDPASDDVDGHIGDPYFPNLKPPPVSSLAASCCDDDPTCCEGEPSGVRLTWTEVDSNIGAPSTWDNPYDLAGYRVFRSATADFSAATMVSGAAPIWGDSFQDVTATDGGTYYYRVVSTDCIYEKVDPSEGTIRSDMLSDTVHSVMLGPVYVGRIQRDEKCPDFDPSAPSCTQDEQREVLTGVGIDNSGGTGTGESSFTDVGNYHHKVTMFFRNTSAGDLTVTGASVSWVNSDAYLRTITIGGGGSGVGSISTNIATSPTTLVPSAEAPYTRGLSNLALTSVTIPGGSRYVPITFEFKDSLGNTTVNMREDDLLVKLNVTNDSTGTTSCVSYLTVSQAEEGVNVPLGPTISAVQQNQPATGTFGYAVPGATGNNTVTSGVYGPVIVDNGVTTRVSAIIASNTVSAQSGQKLDIDAGDVNLLYQDTALTVTTAPTTGYTTLVMSDSVGACNVVGAAGSAACFADIPAVNARRVWYKITAEDAEGNFDRDPEAGQGVYVYDQKAFDVCDLTPSAPTALTVGAIVGPDVVTGLYNVPLTWTAPATYTSGGTIDVSDTLTYKIYRGGVFIGTSATTSYTDVGVTGNAAYTYTVKAAKSCSPTPNVSAASDGVSACVGASGQAKITVSPSTITEGGSYTVTILDCLALVTPHDVHIDLINDAASDIGSGPGSFTNTSASTAAVYAPALSETGIATGFFTTLVQTATDGTGNLLTAASDTITVSYTYAPAPLTVTVTPDPCNTTPNAPTGLSGTVQGQGIINLTWSAVATNTDASPIIDLAGYRVYEKVMQEDGVTIVADWFQRATTAAGTTAITLSTDYGNLNQKLYYFKVTAYDTCATPKESGYSNTWLDPNN